MKTVEERITDAVWAFLTGAVNDELEAVHQNVAYFEGPQSPGALGHYGLLAEVEICEVERTEKERLIKCDAYTVTVDFSSPLAHCYLYAYAISEALAKDATLGGEADSVVFVSRRYVTDGAARNAQFKLRVVRERGGR